MVENNDVQDKIVIRHALKKDAETVFKIIRSFAKYHLEADPDLPDLEKEVQEGPNWGL